MNILPKKSWHVRTKKNIARVRKDEAKAAEEEKETQRRIALAAQEARTALLRERASQRLAAETVSSSEFVEDAGGDVDVLQGPQLPQDDADLRFGIPLGSLKDVVQPDGHVNFFQDVEAGKRQGGTTNEEYEDEKKKEQEDYEKKIGYLVYLGQDSVEQTKQKPWYARIDRGKPEELDKELEKQKDLDRAAGVLGGLEEKSKSISIEDLKMTKSKSLQDPLQDIRKYLSTPGLKKKLDSFPSSSSKSKRKESLPVFPSEVKKARLDEKKKEKKKKHKSKSSKKSKKHKHKSRSSSSKHKKRSRDSSRDSRSASESDSRTSDDDSEDEKKRKLEKLRRERLEREREEKRRAEKVLAKLRGEEEPPEPVKNNTGVPSMASVKQKYNSQFNPHLARQNFD